MLVLRQHLRCIAGKPNARKNQCWFELEKNYPPFDGSQICAQTDPDLWFPTSLKQTGRLAKKLCSACPWKADCLDYALGYDLVGIWGGTTERERVEMRKRLKIKPEPIYSDTLFAIAVKGKSVPSRYNEEGSEVFDD